MKVAVAGGFGFLGSNIVTGLKARGYQTIPFSRRTGVDIRDLQKIDSFLDTEKPEIVVNCAAHVGGIAYNAVAPVDIYEDNLVIGLNLVSSCYRNNVKKMVNIMPNCTYPASADIYEESEWWNGEMHETVLTYGMPRKATWIQCWAYKQKFKFNSIHVVLPNLYGPGDHFDPVRSHAMGALIKKIVDAKINGQTEIEVWGTGKPIREWGYVKDAAEGIIIAMEKYDDLSIINIGSGEGYSIIDIANMIKEAVGWQGKFVLNKSFPDGAPKKILSVEKMHRILDWQPITSINDGIQLTVRWYLQNIEEKK